MSPVEYFVAIEDEDFLQGPFNTLPEAIIALKKISKDRRYTDEEARRFFFDGSSIVQAEILNDRIDFIKVGWLAREQFGIPEPSIQQFLRKRDRYATAKERMPSLQVESNSEAIKSQS